jgi:GNAT superfamily N-acetyltransferase
MPSFRIVTYSQDWLQGMADLYNSETEFEPHIAPLTASRFVEMVERKSYFDPSGLFIAAEGDRVIGWVHACIAPGSEPRHDPAALVARIRLLVYPRDRLDVGAALVSEATAWLRGEGYQSIEAMHAESGYPFYRGLWMGSEPKCLVTMPHIQLALEVGGYRNTLESIYMVADLSSHRPHSGPKAPVEFAESVQEMAHAGMRESWVGFRPMGVRAMVGEEEAGFLGWVLLPHVADRLGAPCLNIWSLWVPEAHRRKGIAGALLSHALGRGRALGACCASVSTQLWNAPAHATYAKAGFVPHTICVGRVLKPESAA